MMAGCSHTKSPQITDALEVQAINIQAVYAKDPIVMDGKLDDAIWKDAPSYEMTLGKDRQQTITAPIEGGTLRFAWNEDFFYLAIDFIDADVVAEGTKDGERHFLLGDLAELFLWPEDNRWYWELYATPHQMQSSFFYPSGGRLGLPSTMEKSMDLTVMTQVQGTLNDWSDRDQGWTAEVAVPVSALTERGESWGTESAWRIQVGRYNYSVSLPSKELSAVSPLTRTNFHRLEEYGHLQLMPKDVVDTSE